MLGTDYLESKAKQIPKNMNCHVIGSMVFDIDTHLELSV